MIVFSWSDDKATKSPVAVISNTTPQTATTKCDDNDAKKNEDPEDQKRLKTPLGTAKPNILQPGDVVTIHYLLFTFLESKVGQLY